LHFGEAGQRSNGFGSAADLNDIHVSTIVLAEKVGLETLILRYVVNVSDGLEQVLFLRREAILKPGHGKEARAARRRVWRIPFAA
jgi:hypothetical protein